MQIRMISIVKLFTLLNHILGEVDGIDSLYILDESPGDIARTSADVEYSARFIGNEAIEYMENLVRIRWTMTIGINDLRIFEGFSKKSAELLWF